MNTKTNIERICELSQDEKKYRDTINANYLSKGDFIICDYITNNIPKVNSISYHGLPILTTYAIKNSLKKFKFFNKENYQRLQNIINNVTFIKDYPLYIYGVETAFNITQNENDINIITPGYITTYHLPKKTYNIDIVSIGHEHCHALKESNYQEQKNSLRFGEVIPIFYELINYENDFLREKYLQHRLFHINQQKNIYLAISEILKGNINNNKLSFLNDDINETKKTYEYVKSNIGSYLGGFYYAIILYSMYKKDPIKILNLVNMVLSHTITTQDMLKRLNIYHSILGEKFEKEITNIKKVLSK